MSEHLGSLLTDDLRRALSEGPPDSSDAHIAITCDADGRPRACMLGSGEILAVSVRCIRAAIWTRSHSLANLRRGAVLLVCVVEQGTPYYIHARPTRHWPLDEESTGVEAEVESLKSDRHAGFRVVGGVQVEPQPHMDVMLRARSARIRDALNAGPPPDCAEPIPNGRSTA